MVKRIYVCNGKGVACSNKPTENLHLTPLLGSKEIFILFQLNVLVSWPATSLF